MWYFDVFAFIFSAHLSASQSIKCRNSHEMSTPDYYSSIIQQLWFISKVQLYLEWKHWNVRWKYCERAMSGDRKRETTHTVRIKLVIMTNVLCAMCRTVFGFVVWFFFSFHAQMFWDACIRSPYTCFVMSSFKGLLSHSVRAFLSNSTDTEKATAWSHNNSIVNTSKSSANALAGWHREEPHEHICTTYQYMRKKTFFAQRIVISEKPAR